MAVFEVGADWENPGLTWPPTLEGAFGDASGNAAWVRLSGSYI